jgi:hypothetical protein
MMGLLRSLRSIKTLGEAAGVSDTGFSGLCLYEEKDHALRGEHVHVFNGVR